jgi:ComF family protein
MVGLTGRVRSFGLPLRAEFALREAVLDAVAVVFPVECAGCGSADRALCRACRAELLGPAYRQVLPDGTSVWSALRYNGRVRAMLLSFKEQGRTDVVRPLSRALSSAIICAAADLDGPVEVCPIPATRVALRRRGFRPVELLLRSAGLRAARVLIATEGTAQQKSLGRAEREGNVFGSLRAKTTLSGRRFLVVDDIVTTGATLREAKHAISEAGGEVVAAATLAFTPKRRAD